MTQIRISIAMTTYNGERFIREQLDSLARQSYLPCELIVSDDGSTDRTLEIVEDFAKTAPFIVRVYRNEQNLGYANNFLKAASLCEGEWIAFCDQDDVWLEKKLEIVSGYFQLSPDIYLITHSAVLVDEKLVPLERIFPRHVTTKVVERLEGRFWYTLYGFTAVFRREVIAAIPWQKRPTDFTDIENKGMQSHDLWVYFLCSCLGKVVLLSDELALYRRHSAALTGYYCGTRIDRLNAILHSGSSHYRFLAGIAREYEDTLLVLADDSKIDIIYRQKLRQAAQFMRVMSVQTNNRSLIHSQGVGFVRRARGFLENINIQMKTPSGDFSTKTFIKDMLVVFGLWRFF
jgi:glycosyltransferase involved in cell wall biosynthesis